MRRCLIDLVSGRAPGEGGQIDLVIGVIDKIGSEFQAYDGLSDLIDLV
jgi:hypothetical protein